MENLVTSKAVVITCNWNAYSGLESAGANKLPYSPILHPIKVNCLGEISVGIILKAFEKGADGVLLLGCPPNDCRYNFGNHRAEEVFSTAKKLIKLLGYQDEQLILDWVNAGEGEGFVEKAQQFVEGLDKDQA